MEAEVPKATVAIYACANAPDDDGGRELAELRRYADLRGWRVAFEQIEQHQTRTTRPALHRVVSDARLHGTDAVVVRQADRLARGSEQVAQLLDELTKSGVKVVSVGERVDATTSDSGLQTRLVNALDALDRVRKSDQVVARRNARKHRESRRLRFVESPLRLAVSSSSMPRDVDHESKDAVTTEPEAASLGGHLDVNPESKSGYQVR